MQGEQAVIGATRRTADLHAVIARRFNVDTINGARHVGIGAATAAHDTNGDTTVQTFFKTKVFEHRFCVENTATAQ